MNGQSDYRCNGTSNNIAKALADSTGWNSFTVACSVGNNQSENNITGFSALPAGYANGNSFGFGQTAIFWSSTENGAESAYYRSLSYYSNKVSSNSDNKVVGFSVRCVRD